MSTIAATFFSTRILSHYTASSSWCAFTSAIGYMSTNSFVHRPLQSWRTLIQLGGTQLAEAPSFGSELSTDRPDNTSSSVANRAADELSDTFPAPAPGRHLQQPKVPKAVLRDLRPPVRPYQLNPVISQRPTGCPARYTPWTPTRVLQRRKHIKKRMGFLVQVLEREQMERVRRARPLPNFRAGDILEIRTMLPEAERKVTIYRGVCIARYHKGIRSSFKIYNVYPECGGVVQHIPLYMPDLLGIKVVGRIPASQERLFYLLDRETSDYTFQTGVSAAN